MSVRDLARIAVFAALTAAMGLVGSITLAGGVPITLQSLGVMLAGAVLGPWRGAASMGLLILGVAIGLPLLAGGRGGIGVFVSPTAGYLIGYVIAPIVIGLIVRGRPTWLRVGLGCLIGGIFSIYVFGIPVQAWLTELSLVESLITSLVFLPGDLTKMVVATLITMALFRASPQSFESEGVQREVAVAH
ncbi:MAG: biotin transporter BioY [Yaniella sp.]|uniref:biotin transporter BioY n=3 Tax=Yaniella sp. TaxID=2773929 RepID=UPI002648AEAC|nr:biotin transporter BioY [Yaniella sp.]MDN5742948.1 biotin transporter BioY [Yaniella sp.]MDN5815522.1 biotin transporter BioY [Yaniella sp.]MDN5818045.1 biotin transporter BioY [Yaniella sp.]MDN5913248.1 biotin transporter BioY [Yaniella sp.]MDN6150858.1 biotin transporter BioY [Yaniella sp.]